MKAMEENLAALGVSKNKIHQEAFSVVPNLSFQKNFKNIFLVYGLSLALFIATLIFVSGAFNEKEGTIKEASKKTSLDLINNVINNRRNSIINTKQTLIDTVKAGVITKTVTEQKVVNTQPTVMPVAQKLIIPPVVNTPKVVTPVVNTPVTVPTPRTRLS